MRKGATWERRATCRCCGAGLAPPLGLRVFCSEACAKEQRRRDYCAEPFKRVCGVCSRGFETRNKTKLYCTANCKRVRDAFKATHSAVIRGHALHRAAKTRAQEKGIQFSLDVRDIIRRIEAGTCEVTGIPFFLRHGSEKSTFKHPFAPSIDRIDPGRGYVAENIQVVAWIYNAAKGQGTHNDVMNLARALMLRERGALICILQERA